ncbi:MAG: amidohydrolase [Sedimentibacter sp.]
MEYKELKNLVYDSIDNQSQKAFALNEYIFKNPELPHKEFIAYEKYLELLRDEGIKVEEKFLGLETAFKATINEDENSDIKIGILAEYDALPEIGHACGHSASGALSFLAALGLYKNKEHLSGNIYLIGTPGEEYNGAKTDLANSGLFNDFSYVIMIHMSDKNQSSSKFMALDAYDYEFFGSPTHAAASPWSGKNAMNGMMLFIHALDMMRQQLRDGTRVHGMIMKAGTAVNVIPDYASCQYWFRYKKKDYLDEVVKFAQEAAEGCAKATQTTVRITSSSRALADLKITPHTDEIIEAIYEELGVEVDKDPIVPLGSSDIGNLSYVCPAFHPVISISDAPVAAHTREFAECIMTEKTKWAIEKGAKTISTLILLSLNDKDIIANMKKDFIEN